MGVCGTQVGCVGGDGNRNFLPEKRILPDGRAYETKKTNGMVVTYRIDRHYLITAVWQTGAVCSKY